jgi:hypothetical protein
MNRIVDELIDDATDFKTGLDSEKLIRLVIEECLFVIDTAKSDIFVSLDDAKKMSHFCNIANKHIKKHFGVK